MRFKKIFNFVKKKRGLILKVLVGILILALLIELYNVNKSLPEGTSLEGEVYFVSEDSVDFLYDLTYMKDGERVSEQVIFDKIFEMIDNAEEFILIDMFLWGSGDEDYRDLSGEMADHLVAKKEVNPNIKINLITDEFNSVYKSYDEPNLARIREAGVNIVYTDMNKMRDSNPVYSGFWRVLGYVWGLPSNYCKFSLISFGGKKTCVRSGLKLVNFKANHRKLIVADSGEKVVSLVTSANPHGGSSEHSNVGVYVEEKIYEDIYFGEKAIADFSGEFLEHEFENVYESDSNDFSVQFLTEGKIAKNIVETIDETVGGESIEVMMFYISDRGVVESLINAANRGVDVKLILDPNKDAFGMEKSGVPGRPVANELVEKTNGEIKVRWYDTHGEQFHTKIIVIRKKDGKTIVILGSANLTKRNLRDYNLEADVKMIANSDSDVIQEIYVYFDKIWFNKNGIYTADYEKYEDNSFLRHIQYRFQEWTGMSTF